MQRCWPPLMALLVLLAVPALPASGQESDQAVVDRQDLPFLAIRIDTLPIALSLESGGPGISLGSELPLTDRLTLLLEGRYMNLADAGIIIMMLMLGPRWYVVPPVLKGFYIGSYPLIFRGSTAGRTDWLPGIMFDAGFTWRIGRHGFFIEPYIKYPLLFGEEALAGIAPGLSLGYFFTERRLKESVQK